MTMVSNSHGQGAVKSGSPCSSGDRTARGGGGAALGPLGESSFVGGTLRAERQVTDDDPA
jgi:hypothetical protein